jgi:hypothetical protein
MVKKKKYESEMKYSYSENMKTSEGIGYREGKKNSKEIRSFDDNRNILESKTYLYEDKKSIPWKTVKYEYNEDGKERLVSTYFYGKLTTKTEKKYSSKGHLIKKLSYKKDGSIEGIGTYEYSSDGKLKSYNFSWNEQRYSNRYILNYHPNKIRIENRYSSPDFKKNKIITVECFSKISDEKLQKIYIKHNEHEF